MSDDNDNVVDFTGLTVLPIPPDQVLEGAKGKLSSVIIIGIEKEEDSEGNPYRYYASSGGTNGENLWEAELFKKFLLEEL